MTEYEAYELAAQYIQLSHEIGESNHFRIQFWVGVSFTLLGLTYLVPDRLTRSLTGVILLLYLSFTTYVMAENYYDLSTGIQAALDAQRIAEKANIEVLVVTEKTRSQRDDDLIFWQGVGQLFIPGLFLAVIVYLPVTTFRQRRAASQ
ncbi:MAG: hypothetical protein ABJK25_00005 [Halieaceae bacterium]